MPRKLKDDTYVDGPPPLELSSEAKEAADDGLAHGDLSETHDKAPLTPTFRRPTVGSIGPNAGVGLPPSFVSVQPAAGAEDLADMIATLAAGDGLKVPARDWASGPWLLAAGALLRKGFDLRIAYIAKPEEEPFYRVVADR